MQLILKTKNHNIYYNYCNDNYNYYNKQDIIYKFNHPPDSIDYYIETLDETLLNNTIEHLNSNYIIINSSNILKNLDINTTIQFVFEIDSNILQSNIYDVMNIEMNKISKEDSIKDNIYNYINTKSHIHTNKTHFNSSESLHCNTHNNKTPMMEDNITNNSASGISLTLSSDTTNNVSNQLPDDRSYMNSIDNINNKDKIINYNNSIQNVDIKHHDVNFGSKEHDVINKVSDSAVSDSVVNDTNNHIDNTNVNNHTYSGNHGDNNQNDNINNTNTNNYSYSNSHTDNTNTNNYINNTNNYPIISFNIIDNNTISDSISSTLNTLNTLNTKDIDSMLLKSINFINKTHKHYFNVKSKKLVYFLTSIDLHTLQRIPKDYEFYKIITVTLKGKNNINDISTNCNSSINDNDTIQLYCYVMKNIDCTNCINCYGCINCHNCTNCYGCTNVKNSTDCFDCYESENLKHCVNCFMSDKCIRCKYCINTSKCRDCISCVKITKCYNSMIVFDSIKCKNSVICDKCYKCNNISWCTECSNCNNCCECHWCNNCIQCDHCKKCNDVFDCNDVDNNAITYKMSSTDNYMNYNVDDNFVTVSIVDDEVETTCDSILRIKDRCCLIM